MKTKQKISEKKKWPKYLNRHFTEEDIQGTAKYMKDFSTLLVIREVNIKTTRYQYTPFKMIKNRPTISSLCKDTNSGNSDNPSG